MLAEKLNGMLAKNLIRNKCNREFQGIISIECKNLKESVVILKALDSLGFKWRGGKDLLGNIENDYKSGSHFSYNGDMFIGIVYEYNTDECCIGYRNDVNNKETHKMVKPISYCKAIEILKEVRKEIKNVDKRPYETGV